MTAWVRGSFLAGLAMALAIFSPSGGAAADDVTFRSAPEAWSGIVARQAVHAVRHMISASHPLAAEAGLAILSRGGSAVDAAIAAQMVLTLVEPQSSGIGGGGFLVHHDAARGETLAYDGRETAPAAATADMFMDAAGEPMAFFDAVVGGLSVGVPGLVPMLEMAHDAHGVLPWRELFERAIELAEVGFPVSPRLHTLIAGDRYLKRHPETAAYFHLDDGMPLPVGRTLRNPALAATLRRVADQKSAALHSGELAAAIVAAVRDHEENPGRLTAEDLAAYRPVVRQPVCAPYREYEVCGMPAPSSGPLAVLQILGMLQRFDMAGLGAWSVESVHLFAEASRLAFADRNAFLADPDFVDVPAEGLLDPRYLLSRSETITPDASHGHAVPGEPPRRRTDYRPSEEDATRPPSTMHLSVVDGDGNVVSMTSSVENAFGSRIMVGGFILNNQLTDFSFRPSVDGRPVANRVEPGKRPRSSMAPMIAFDRDGDPVLAIGSPGGSRIIGYVAKALIGFVDWNLDVQEAISLPNVTNQNGPTDLEADTAVTALKASLERLGHEVRIVPMTSGLHGIRIETNRLVGGADPRREGLALGE